MKSKSEIDAYVDRWCDAAESGAYEQGQGSLNKDNSFCYLGVLCDLLKNEFELQIARNFAGETTYNDAAETLPGAIVDELGISGSGEFFDEERFIEVEVGGFPAFSVAQANDKGATFPEISAAIRANKHLLFKAYRDGVAA